MAKGPRKQTVKFFFHHDRLAGHQGKVFMVLVLSRTALWRVGKFDGEKIVDQRVGDRARIERKGHLEWMQRNAFLYWGYPYSLFAACDRLDIPMEIQHYPLPRFVELMHLYAPIGKDQICFFIDETRTPARQYAGLLYMVFRSDDRVKLQLFRGACREDEQNGDVADIWPDDTVQADTVIAKTYYGNVLSLRDYLRQANYPASLSVQPVPTYEALLLSHAVYQK